MRDVYLLGMHNMMIHTQRRYLRKFFVIQGSDGAHKVKNCLYIGADLTNLIVQSIMVSEEILYCDDMVTIKPQYIKKEELHYIKNIYKRELRKKLKELHNLLDFLLTHDGRENNCK